MYNNIRHLTKFKTDSIMLRNSSSLPYHLNFQVQFKFYIDLIICKKKTKKQKKTHHMYQQEAHGPHRSPEKTVQINKHIWLHHNVNKEKKKTLLTSWKFIGSSFERTWIPFTQGCFVLSLVEIGPLVLEKKILKFRQCIFAVP